MDNKFNTVSMNGRMAYVIMCVEAFLKVRYPERDWSLVSEVMWEATSTNWGDWPEKYSSILPDVLLQYDRYDSEELGESLSKAEYITLRALYAGITNGIEDDPTDEVNYMLNKPYEMAMVYEGTVIGNGEESLAIISNAEHVLKKYNIPVPNYEKVKFSSSQELNGWGNDFDGRPLSIILN